MMRATTITAKPVVASRIALPTKAGQCDPELFRDACEVAERRNLVHMVLAEERQPRPLPRGCLLVDAREERALRCRMVECGMAVLVPEGEVPLDADGRKIHAGLFAVPHKAHCDRLIFDRRPQKAGERRLRWARLPHGTMFTQTRLRPNQILRGSGEEISIFFYHLKSPLAWWKRNCYGRVFRVKTRLC